MQLKPKHILLYISILLISVIFASIIFPESGIRLSDKTTLKFHFNIGNSNTDSASYVDIASIIEGVEGEINQQDDSLNTTKSIVIDTIKADHKKLRSKIQPIEYPSGNSNALHPFFRKLKLANKKRIRIMHYGDSQIEGDRITGYLRNKFQNKFGGSGIGLMPIVPPRAESSSIIHKASGNWRKHAVYYKKDTLLPHRNFGVMGSFARFTSYLDDSLNINTTPVSATVSFNKSGMAYRSVQKFYTCRVFYGNYTDNCIVKGFVNDSLVWFQELEPTNSTKMFQWDFTSPPKAFKIEIEGTKSPDFYCVSLDANKGVAVDNLPFRGSSGMEFTKLNYTNMKELIRHFNTGLVILEFGVNVVPYPSSNFNFYERAITRQIKYLKKLMPDASFLVIGLSDMSKKQGDYYITHHNVEKVLKAQRNAAENAGCAFWNMYEAMGGRNSMPSWVFATPPLAQKDFIHFNRKGGHIISQMLFNAIMNEYDSYCN